MNKRGFDETNNPRGDPVDWFTSSDDLDGYPDIEDYDYISHPGCSRDHEAGGSQGVRPVSQVPVAVQPTGGYAPDGIQLEPVAVRHLESLGFNINELCRMRFASVEAAREWYQQQLFSPKKMKRFSAAHEQDGYDQQPVPTVPLTARQRSLLMSHGFPPEELYQKRFFTVREGFNWVGEMLNRSFENYHYYESMEDPYITGGGDWYGDDCWDNQGPYASSGDDWDQHQWVRQEEPWPIVNHHPPPPPPPRAPLPQPDQPVNAVVDLTAEDDAGHENRAHVKDDDNDHSGGPTCGICFETMGPSSDRCMAAGNCGHVYCRPCLEHAVRQRKKCPTCSKKMYWKSIRNIYL